MTERLLAFSDVPSPNGLHYHWTMQVVMTNFAFEMMNFALKRRNFVFEMTGFAGARGGIPRALREALRKQR